jgi:transaldolase
MRSSPLHQLSDLGQSVWIDYLSRELLETGELARLIEEDAVVGVTSNPTIFQKAISGGSAYDAQLVEVRDEESDPKELFYELAARDVATASDVLLPIWKATGGHDGYVSWEIDPNLAHDRRSSYEEAQRLHTWIDRPNLYVKIPATTAGVGAIEDMVAAGKNINVTLIFSLQRYREVVEAYIHGLERLVAGGGTPATVHSVASFFVSRVDTEADKRLDAIGGHAELKGKLGIANAKLAYQDYLAAFAGQRWERLASEGATTQRCLWASTSTKDPAYADVMYVEGLIGPQTVNTMPKETIHAFQDHGRVAETLTHGMNEARRLFDELEEAGVDYDDVVATLAREGIDKFSASFADLLEGVHDKAHALVPTGPEQQRFATRRSFDPSGNAL